MSVDDLYEFTVEWPSPSAQTVIVTGDFDQWSKSCHLSRTSTGVFSTTLTVPYGCPTRYKFIVDGEWKILEDKPIERTPEGYLNNIHYVPLEKPGLGPEGAAKPKAGETNASSNGEQEARLQQTSSPMPRLISDLANTIAARDGTSSPLGYVASGIGATIHSVVGVDPINSNQISISTPTSHEPPQTTSPPTTSANLSFPQYPFAPIIPIPIVPVYAKENCTIDPSRRIHDDADPGFTGVGSLRAREDRGDPNAEEAEEAGLANREMGISTHAPVVPPINAVITSAPTPNLARTPAVQERVHTVPDATSSTVRKNDTTREGKGETVVNAAEVQGTTAVGVVPTLPRTDAPAPKEEVPVRETQRKATTSPHELPQLPLLPTTTKAPTDGNTNGINDHQKPPSSVTAATTTAQATSVTSTSRPSTPTPAAANSNAVPSSTPSTPHSIGKKRKIFPHLGNGSPPKSRDEGNGTASWRKKRTSSIFGKLNLKNLFHHDKKDENEGNSLDTQ